MKKYSFILPLVLCLFCLVCVSGQSILQSSLSSLPEHPRILLLKGEEKDIIEKFEKEETWKKIHQFILNESDSLISKPVLQRIQIGRRLLSVSRECLRRLFYLSYAYRFTNDIKYMKRAEQEMLAVSSFTDWNPSHFLDVAEMTAGMAIGYDWLYNDIPYPSLEIIKNAIISKGLEPSMVPNNNGWLNLKHNWNQVCNTGMTLGALAIYEDRPEFAKQIIDRAIKSIELPMKEYGPDGAYPEGYSYWDYGTSFNVLFLSVIEKAYGHDFGLAEIPGFLKTAGYLFNMTGPSLMPFNYSDCGPRGTLNPAMFWFASRLNDYSLLKNEIRYLSNPSSLKSQRLLPSMIVWGAGINLKNVKEPEELIWVGQGITPVALMHTSLVDPDAIFVGIKGGTPSSNHSHMDIGSFVMDAIGERWAMDFGSQDYNSLESKNVNLWAMDQNSQRWEVFRYNNFSHNTITINGELQCVEGHANITGYTSNPMFLSAKTDLSEVYKNSGASLERGIAIIDKKYVIVQDEITTEKQEIILRWNMLTQAAVKITGKRSAMLIQNGKKLKLIVVCPDEAMLTMRSTEPTHEYDAPNPGTVFVGFEVRLLPESKNTCLVMLVPKGNKYSKNKKITPLQDWK